MDNNPFAKEFNENMTDLEARTQYFKLIDGLTEEEREQLRDAYRNVIGKIFERQTKEIGFGTGTLTLF